MKIKTKHLFLHFLSIIGGLWLQSCNPESSVEEPAISITGTSTILPLAKQDFSKIKSGDIILKQGYGSLSSMIVRNLKEPIPLSHCGMLSRRGDSIYIIHSVARELTGINGVQQISLDEFLKDCKRNYLFVVRLNADSVQQGRIDHCTHNYLHAQIPFDYDLDNNDSTAVNCSEFVYQVLKTSTGRDYFKRKFVKQKEVLTFNSLLDSTSFKTIYHY